MTIDKHNRQLLKWLCVSERVDLTPANRSRLVMKLMQCGKNIRRFSNSNKAYYLSRKCRRWITKRSKIHEKLYEYVMKSV